MTPDIVARRVGTDGQPVVVVNHFHPDPDGLRTAAVAAEFGPARNHYPGVRAPLPADYFDRVRPALVPVLRDVFGQAAVDLIDASFSIVTTPADALSVEQRLPHVDAVDAGRIALVHYLSTDNDAGTAFYRHRRTGLETIDAARAASYFACLRAEIAADPPPVGYIDGDTALFERIAHIPARYNRAVIYRSAMLHSGAIAPEAKLSADPATGRLTVTAFLSAA